MGIVKLKKGLYLHYKGLLVEVYEVVRHSETLEEMVYYKELSLNKDYGKNSLWVRPLKMFQEEVEVEGKKIPRFTYLKNG